MIQSMTGFGRGRVAAPGKIITIEIKSLNSKQFDLSMRVPPLFRELEVEARNRMAAVMERGKVEMAVSVEQTVVDAPAQINLEVMAAYKKQLENMADAIGIDKPHGNDWYTLLLRMPDVMKTEVHNLDAGDKEAFFNALNEALTGIEAFRSQEGAKLYTFFCSKLDNIAALLAEVEPFENSRVVRIKERLVDQLEKLSGIEYDKGRLEQELIFYIEKLDVTEEKTRLAAHINYFRETMDGAARKEGIRSVGKKLGFIAQEMGREINTLGSKSNEAEMQKIVVRMKDELEQIKEQVLNVL